MKKTISLWLSAVGVLTYSGIVSAAPPFIGHYVNREGGNEIYAESYAPMEDGVLVRHLQAFDSHDVKRTYQYSEILFNEWGYSTTTPYFNRWVYCYSMGLGNLLSIGPGARTVSLSVYLPPEMLNDPDTCVVFYYNADPLGELAVSASLTAPLTTGEETSSGSNTNESGTTRYVCKTAGGVNYLNGVVAVNDETWLPVEGEAGFFSWASSNVCNSNNKQE